MIPFDNFPVPALLVYLNVSTYPGVGSASSHNTLILTVCVLGRSKILKIIVTNSYVLAFLSDDWVSRSQLIRFRICFQKFVCASRCFRGGASNPPPSSFCRRCCRSPWWRKPAALPIRHPFAARHRRETHPRR